MQLKAIDTKTQILFGSAGLHKNAIQPRPSVSPSIQSSSTRINMSVQPVFDKNVRYKSISTIKMSASS